jgi:hypothetical protein
MKKRTLFLIVLLLSATGCIGWNVPNPFQAKPYAYLRGGEQFGRDQLANRFLVGEKIIPIKGKDSRDILSLLGQPQEIQVIERNISEDWLYVYYKKYKTWPRTDEGTFVVRIYNEEVLDVVGTS